MARMEFRAGDRLVFQGDSITDCGRRDDPFGLGDGYVAMIKGLLTLGGGEQPEVINRGVGGDRSAELVKRWKEDCLDLAPTHVSIMIGVNDIWHDNVGRGIALPEYLRNVRQLIESALDAGVRELVLVTPTTVDADPRHSYNVKCADYAAAVEGFAGEYKATLVPARDRMWHAVEGGPSVGFYLPDGVHPSAAGHAVLAGAWLEAIGMM